MFIDISKMKDIDQIKNDYSEKLNISNLATIAKVFIESQKWCKYVKKGYLVEAFEGILGIFYFEVEVFKEADEKLWVICGDIPPAYIVLDNSKNAFEALNNYVGEMMLWVNAVKANKSVEGLIPVNVNPKKKYADLLDRKLKFIDKEILPILSQKE